MQRSPNPDTQTFARKYIVLLVCIAAVFGSVWLIYKFISMRDAPGVTTRTNTICCTDVVTELARTVNTSLDPCVNFYDYVCSNTITLKKQRYAWATDYYLNAVKKGSTSVVNTAGGMSLLNFYKSCLAVKNAQELFAQLTAAFLRHTNVQSKMNGEKVRRLLMCLTFRYQYNSVIQSGLLAAIPNATVQSNIGNFPPLQNATELARAVIKVFNEKLHTSLTMEQLKRFELSKIKRPTGHLVTLSLDNLRGIFSASPGELWGDVEADLYDADMDTIDVALADLNTLLDALTDSKNQPASIAYIIYAAVYSASSKLSTLDSNHSGTCVDQLRQLYTIWDVLYADSVSNDARDRYMQELYGEVKEAVVNTAIRMKFFKDNDRSRINSLLSEMKLLLPREYSVTEISVPSMQSDFASNLLDYSDHAASVRRVRMARNIPTVATMAYFSIIFQDKYVFISPGYYQVSYFDKPFGMFLDVPLVGIPLAVASFYKLVESLGEKFDSFSECLSKYYTGTGLNRDDWGYFTTVFAVALPSAQAIAKTYDWNTMKSFGSWNLSMGMLFYIRFADALCLRYGMPGVSRVNAPVMLSEDFARTFSCKEGSKMAPRITCP